MLVAPDRDKLVFINIPATPICRIYLAPCRVTPSGDNCCRLTHSLQAEGHKGQEVVVVSISSTRQCIDDVTAMCPSRKYKSCLSFTPSSVRHISILSGESPTQKYRGFINLIAIMFVILNLRNIVDNFYRYGARFKNAPFEFLPYSATIGFCTLLVFAELAYRLDRLRFHRILSDSATRLLLNVNQVTLLVYIALYCANFLRNNPVSGLLFTGFGLVLFLKLISYMQVNTEILSILDRSAALARSEFNEFVFANHEINAENLEIIVKNRKDWQLIITRKRLAYFLIAPTLCYQLEYPQSPTIRVPWLLKRVAELVVICALLQVLWVQYMEPELEAWFSISNSGKGDWMEVGYRLMRLSIPNTIGWIMGFYCFFHLLLNVISEVIHFGDRNFYMDWWNCRNLEEYWKTWNLPVHFFFIRHCYTPLLKKGWSKLAANFLVFILSAVAHEYLVCVPLGVMSYYAFLAMLLQAPAIAFEKLLSKYLKLYNSELGNVSFWLFFCMLGQPICFFIYYSQYVSKNYA
jgi:diacylglycerol O-acyltransferase 1